MYAKNRIANTVMIMISFHFNLMNYLVLEGSSDDL